MRFTQEMQCQQQNKKGRCFLNGPPLSKQKTVMKEKKPNEAEKGKFALKGEQTFSAFWFLCKLNKKKGSVLFFFLAVFHSFAPPQKRADSGFLTSAERPSRHNSSCLPVGCVTLSSPALCVQRCRAAVFSTSVSPSGFTPSAFLSRTPCCDGESVLCSRVR